MEAIRAWIFGLTGAAIITGIAISITPKGRVKSVLRLSCGAVMIIALIKPVIDFDFDTYSMGLAKYRADMDSLKFDAEESSDRLRRTIIEEECSAYILDKAQVLSLDAAKAAVKAKWGDEGYWYPYEAHLEINGSEEGRDSLAEFIESELGIPRKRQYWSEYEA